MEVVIRKSILYTMVFRTSTNSHSTIDSAGAVEDRTFECLYLSEKSQVLVEVYRCAKSKDMEETHRNPEFNGIFRV